MPPSDLTVHDLGATLAALKESVRTATDFMVPWDRFHDDFAAVYGLAPPGEIRSNPGMVQAIAQLVEKYLGIRAPVAEARLLYVPEHHFWHGFCRVGAAWVFFFNFDDISVGMAGLQRSLESREVTLIRLTTLPISRGAPPGTVQ